MIPTLVPMAVTPGEMTSLFVIACCALLGPLLSTLTRKRIPDVVWLLVMGVAVGPHGLGWASGGGGVALVRELGLGLLFLLAGYEVDTQGLRGRQGRMALLSWLVSLGLGFAGATLLVPHRTWPAVAAVGIAVTSTALGTLLPILKEAGATESALGRAFFVHGAIGEVGPVIAMTVLLGTRDPGMTMAVLAVFIISALLALLVPSRVVARFPRISRVILRGTNTTAQTMLRLVFVLLTGLMALSAVLDLDVVLGAFAAGLIVRVFTPHNDHSLDRKLTTVAFSFLVPVFFVTSGMSISLGTVAKHWPVLLSIVATILVARGLPIVALEFSGRSGSGIVSPRDKVRLGLYGAAGLPIIVAVTEVAAAEHLIPDDLASVMVAAGAVTVLVFPLIAHVLATDEEDDPLALVELD